jgi:hypothetical protein
MANRGPILCLPILLLGLGASALHATDFRGAVDIAGERAFELTANDRFLSRNGRYELAVRKGRAIIGDLQTDKIVWSTAPGNDFWALQRKVADADHFTLELQSSGQIVFYMYDRMNKKTVIWSSGASLENATGARFEMGDNGVLKVFVRDSGGNQISPELWKSSAH